MGYMGIFYNLPRAVFYLLKGDYIGYKALGFRVAGFQV